MLKLRVVSVLALACACCLAESPAHDVIESSCIEVHNRSRCEPTNDHINILQTLSLLQTEHVLQPAHGHGHVHGPGSLPSLAYIQNVVTAKVQSVLGSNTTTMIWTKTREFSRETYAVPSLMLYLGLIIFILTCLREKNHDEDVRQTTANLLQANLEVQRNKEAMTWPCFLIGIGLVVLEISCSVQYIPQMQLMAKTFEIMPSEMALTLQLNWIMKAVANMIAGPLSDRYGRKPVMLASNILLSLSCLGCANSSNIAGFLAFRVLQGLGQSSDVLIAAMYRDAYDDIAERSRVQGAQELFSLIARLAAPFLALFVDQYFNSWRPSFVVLALLVIVLGTLFALMSTESLDSSRQVSDVSYTKNIKAALGSKLLVVTLTSYVFMATQPLLIQYIIRETYHKPPVWFPRVVVTLAAMGILSMVCANFLMKVTGCRPNATLRAYMFIWAVVGSADLVLALTKDFRSIWVSIGMMWACAGVTVPIMVFLRNLYTQTMKDTSGTANAILMASTSIFGSFITLFSNNVAVYGMQGYMIMFGALALFTAVIGFNVYVQPEGRDEEADAGADADELEDSSEYTGPRKIRITIKYAVGLRLQNYLANRMYVVCKVSGGGWKGEEWKTMKIGGTTEPEWMETREVKWCGEAEKVKFTIFNEGRIGSKVQGKVKVRKENFIDGAFDSELPIDGNADGILAIRIEPFFHDRPTTKEIKEDEKPFPYLELWRAVTIVSFIISVVNINWYTTPIKLGVGVAVIQGLLHWTVIEFPMKTIATMATNRVEPSEANSDRTTLCLNYNLLAMSQADVDECMQNMLEAYTNSLNENVSAVLVSASPTDVIQAYESQVCHEHRSWLYKQLFRSGLVWAGFVRGEAPENAWQVHVWAKYEHIDRSEFVEKHLHNICERYSKEYMVLHRTSRVLRKCGQYQDLIMLSSGEDAAFTYCDVHRYGSAARPEGLPLFKPSADSANTFDRKFDYTLVLDADTRVEKGTVQKLLGVAVAHPDKAIIQPGIKMYCERRDPIFMHIEVMRQRIYEPMYNSIVAALGKSSFFGKGLIKNSLYQDACVGTRAHLVESVPIDVLSHDTFEAAVTEVMYCNSVQLLEAPPQTYITWDIRERRWNLGEFILAGYFWPNFVGRPMHLLQSWVQGKRLFRKQNRTKPNLDGPTAYLAHAALRQMIMKPCLLMYVIMMHFASLHWRWLPFVTVLFLVIVFPKFAVTSRDNLREVLLETWASLMQFTPEAVVGTIRVVSALFAHLVGKVSWTPQRAVEEESKASNPFLFSLRYLWHFSVLAAVWTLRHVRLGVIPLKFTHWQTHYLYFPNFLHHEEAIFIATIMGTLFFLPIYAGFTALRADTFGRFFVDSTLPVLESIEEFAQFSQVVEEEPLEANPEKALARAKRRRRTARSSRADPSVPQGGVVPRRVGAAQDTPGSASSSSGGIPPWFMSAGDTA